MDPLKLRALGVMILAMLQEGDQHPYEMMRLMRARRDDRLVKLQNGTFYHQIGALERDGLIAEVGVDREGKRPERTTYTLLTAGREAIDAWLRDRLARGDKAADFRVALAEAHNLPREACAALLRGRLATLRADHEAWREGLDGAASRGVDPQYLIEIDRALALQSTDITWTEGLLERLGDPIFAWQCPSEQHLRAKHPAAPTPPAAIPAQPLQNGSLA